MFSGQAKIRRQTCVTKNTDKAKTGTKRVASCEVGIRYEVLACSLRLSSRSNQQLVER